MSKQIIGGIIGRISGQIIGRVINETSRNRQRMKNVFHEDKVTTRTVEQLSLRLKKSIVCYLGHRPKSLNVNEISR